MQQMGRRAVAAVVLGVILAACGTSTPTGSGAGGGSTSGTSSSSAQSAADVAAAKVANLRLSDFPSGWTSQPSDNSTSGTATIDHELASCMQTSESVLNGSGPSADSPDFSDSNGSTASSTVGYETSAAKARSDFAVLQSPRLPGCMSQALDRYFRDQIQHPSNPSDTLPAGVGLGQVTVAPLSFPQTADGTVAYRVTVPITGGGISISVYADLVATLKGRAGAMLFLSGTGTPMDPTLERNLTNAVVGRMANT